LDKLPKFNETFGPILKILAEGETIHHRELIKKVQSEFYADLPEELLDLKTKSGERLLNNRIAWGKSYLKKGGFVHYPKRGFVQITEKGKRAAKSNLDLKKVTSDFFHFYTEEDKKDKELPDVEDSSPQDLIDSGFAAIESQIKEEGSCRVLGPYF
jgi:restriction system protein